MLERESRGATCLSSFTQIEAEERVLVADVEQPVRERWIWPDHTLQDLCAGKRPKRLRRGGGENELTTFARDQEPIAGEQDAARAELLLAPLHHSGLKLHGA